MTRRIPLADLEARITTVKGWPHGLQGLLFVCPLCPDGHSHLIPFHDGPLDKQQDRKPPIIWSKAAASNGAGPIAGLTLSPSYLTSCLHAYVRDGHLEVL